MARDLAGYHLPVGEAAANVIGMRDLMRVLITGGGQTGPVVSGRNRAMAVLRKRRIDEAADQPGAERDRSPYASPCIGVRVTISATSSSN